MSGESRQATFGQVSVNEYNGEYGGPRRCDAKVDYEGDGTPIRCSNGAKYAILRHLNGRAEFYCKQHMKPTWLEMTNDR